MINSTSSDTRNAIEFLEQAIALHVRHMSGKAPTTGVAGAKSQMEMMGMMKSALSALQSNGPSKDGILGSAMKM